MTNNYLNYVEMVKDYLFLIQFLLFQNVNHILEAIGKVSVLVRH